MRKIKPFVGIGIILIIWFVVNRLGIFSNYVLPAPEKVFQTFWKMVQSGELFVDIVISFGRVLKGFLIAFVLAFALGTFRVLFPSAQGYYDAIVQFFRNVPPLSMIPLLILWCGIGETTKIVIISRTDKVIVGIIVIGIVGILDSLALLKVLLFPPSHKGTDSHHHQTLFVPSVIG